jgi:Fe-S cluster assembly protein SufD
MAAPVALNPFEERLIAALPESGTDWRARLARQIGTHGLPHRRVEEWKWTDLRAALAKSEAGAGELVVTGSREPDETAPVSSAPFLLMPRLAAALGGDACVFRIGKKQDGPLELDLTVEAGMGHGVVVVNVARGVKAELRERYHVAPGAFANIAVIINLGEDAELVRLIEQADSAEGVLVVTTGAELGEGARFDQTTLGFGGRLARLETHVGHPGEGAEVILNGAYVLGQGRHLDQTTYVTHNGPNGVTRELFKGAALAGGKGVFQGKIHVEREAQKTDAQMNHRGLLLDERAEIDTKPELEIYADDVVCAHGAALGAVDAEALFYMRQRGMTETQARAVLTESFLAEPLDRLADEGLKTRWMDMVRGALRPDA